MRVPAMTKAQFEFIAETVHTLTTSFPFSELREDIARHFANNLAATNSRFDRTVFLAACGCCERPRSSYSPNDDTDDLGA